MTTPNWLLTNNQLTATISIQDLPDAQTAIDQYQVLLQQWQSLSHPAILPIKESKVDIIDGMLKATILIEEIATFEPSNTASLLTLDKLFVMKQTIDLDNYVNQNDLKLNWKMSCLYLHPTGICAWLPPLPSQILNSSQNGIINLLFELFDLKINEMANWKDLIRSEKIPWEWGAFIEHCLENKSELNPTQVFSFIFYQAWLYTTANRQGMKDKMMSKSEYASLYKFGLSLGLSDQEIQHLNIIAQQQHPDWGELLSVLN
ncbi:hypothetical protein QUF74_12560 [Candidatus Halobeggiatoa sp. HSG11]|nr:hypothetical protein [Candidatus Halobeggiatoa sp. HSG11]